MPKQQKVQNEQISLDNIAEQKKIFFCSDLHLGRDTLLLLAQPREKIIVKWLESISQKAYAIFFLGDIFDFWFEYKHVIPHGSIRFQAKIQELVDQNVKIFFFTGNHDIWMDGYFEKYLGVKVIKNTAELKVNNTNFYIGHGDELINSKKYMFLKKYIYNNKFCRWLFKNIHPDIGITMAKYIISQKKNKITTNNKDNIYFFCKNLSTYYHYDYYLFGHMHYPQVLKINSISTYYNLGDWITHYSYGEFDGKRMYLKKFEYHNPKNP